MKKIIIISKSFFHNFNLKKNDKPIIFLICVVISTILWLLFALGKRYEETLPIPTLYTNLPENKTFSEPPPDKLQLKVEASGFTLLRYKLRLSIAPITLDIQEMMKSQKIKSSETSFLVISEDYYYHIAYQLGSDIKIIDIDPNTIKLSFSNIVQKKVKVQPELELEFQKQYFLVDHIESSPDSVTIKGPETVVDKINEVQTTKYTQSKINLSFRKELNLVQIPGISISIPKVIVDVPVSQFTEYSNKFTLETHNVPENSKLITFPSKVKISCLVPLAKYKTITSESFVIGVDFNDIKANSKTLPVKVFNVDQDVKIQIIQPGNVEFFIENK